MYLKKTFWSSLVILNLDCLVWTFHLELCWLGGVARDEPEGPNQSQKGKIWHYRWCSDEGNSHTCKRMGVITQLNHPVRDATHRKWSASLYSDGSNRHFVIFTGQIRQLWLKKTGLDIKCGREWKWQVNGRSAFFLECVTGSAPAVIISGLPHMRWWACDGPGHREICLN